MGLLRRLLVLILAASLAASPAFGITPTQRLLLSNAPSWIMKGGSADLYFSRNGGSCGVKTKVVACSSLLTTTRASTKYVTWADGHLSQVAANVLPLSDLGVSIEQASTNVALQSQTFSNASWTKGSAGVGSAAVVTANFDVAPDGTTTASRVQYALNGGTTTAAASRLTQSLSGLTISTVYTWSIYLKSNTASSYVMTLQDFQNATTKYITVTPVWQRFNLQSTTAGTVAIPLIGLLGGQSTVNSDSADILAWGGQWEAAAFATSYIPTTTVAVTRAADVISLTGDAATAALAAHSALSITNLVQGASGAARIVQWSGAANLRFGSTTTVVTAAPPNSATATIGNSGATTGLVKAAFGFDAASLTAVANGGTKVTNANPWISNTGTVFLGSNSGSAVINGLVSRLVFGPSKGQFDGFTQ